MKMMILLISSVLVLSGCSVHRVAGEIAGVDVEASRSGDHHKGSDSQGSGKFCPPWQAKKGNCH